MTTATKTFTDEINYSDTPALQPAPIKAPRTLKTPGIVAGQIDAEGAARAKADEADARTIGLSPKPPVYEIGSRVNAIGVGNFQRSRDKYEDNPYLAELNRNFGELVRNEERADFVVPAGELLASPTGAIVHAVGETERDWQLTERALLGLAARVTPGGAKYLAQCPADLRAANLNHWFKERGEGELTLRTRNVPGSTPNVRGKLPREIYAACGPKYASFDVDKVMQKAADAIGHDARGKVTYDGYRMTMDALFHTNVEPKNAVAGEFFKGVIRVRAADDGSGSVNVSLGLWRNLCLNLIIIDFSKVLVGSRSHIGADTIEADIAKLMEVANERIGLVVGKWSEANVENVLQRYDLQDVDQVFKGLVLNGAVKATGVKPDEMVKRLHTAWEREPGYSKASILNAITRAAHESEWRSWADSEDLESTAGELLYQPVWNLDIRDKSAEEILA